MSFLKLMRMVSISEGKHAKSGEAIKANLLGDGKQVFSA
jgi:hypothetical protein